MKPANRQEVCTLSWTVHRLASDVLCIRWPPGSGIVSPCWMLNLNDLCTNTGIRISGFVEEESATCLTGAGPYRYIGLPEVSQNLRTVWLGALSAMFTPNSNSNVVSYTG